MADGTAVAADGAVFAADGAAFAAAEDGAPFTAVADGTGANGRQRDGKEDHRGVHALARADAVQGQPTE